MMDPAGVFVLFFTIFNGSSQVEIVTQEFETHTMCVYAKDQLNTLYTGEYARVYSACLPKEEK